MLLKIMSNENLPDDDNRKAFRLYSGVSQVEFQKVGHPTSTDEPAAYAHVLWENGESESLRLGANAYVMNDAGKTVASFAAGRLGEPR